MKQLIYLLVTVFVICSLSLSTAAAFSPNATVCNTAASQSPGAASSDLCKSNSTSANPLFGPKGVFTVIINIFSWVVGITATLMIVIAGFMYMTSGGDPQKTNQAKDTILFAIIGLIIVAVCQTLVFFVINNI